MPILPTWKNTVKKGILRYIYLVIVVSALVFCLGATHAVLSVGPNPYLSYQGRLSDQNGNLLTGNYYITFCIYASSSPATACTPPTTPSQGAIGVLSGSALNSALWGDVEYFSATNTPDNHVVNGVFNAKLGSQSSFPATLFNANSQLWLGVNIYNGSSWDGQMSPLQEIVSSGFAINAGMLSGFSASQTPGANNVVVLDGSGNLTINTGTKNIFGASADSNSAYGIFNIGAGGFAGGGTNFSGSSSGTLLALNAPSGFGGNLIDVQTKGVSRFKVDNAGNSTSIGNATFSEGNITLGQLSNASTAPTLSVTNSGGSLAAGTWYGKYTWYNQNGETQSSNESTQVTTTGGASQITFTIPVIPSGATGAKLYLTPVNGASGSEVYQNVTITSGTTGAVTAYNAGAAPPSNTTGGLITLPQNFQIDSFQGNRPTINSSSLGLVIENTSTGADNFIFDNYNGSNPGGRIYLNPGEGTGNVNVIRSANAGYTASQDLKITGQQSNKIGTLTLDATSTVLTGNDNIFSSAVNAGANYGVLNVGSGGFAGSGGNFAGSLNGTQFAINASSGFTGNLFDAQTNGTSKFKVDNAGNITGTGNDNILSSVANAGANYGVFNIGAGGFGGGAGNFSGSSSGTLLALNATSSFAGDLANLQTNGVSEFKLTNNGTLTAGGYITPPTSAPTLSCSAGGALGATTYYVKYTWVSNSGETTASNEYSQACGASTLLNVTVPSFPTNVIAANVYVATSSGAEKLQPSTSGSFIGKATISTTGGTWIEATSGLVSSSATTNLSIPTSNTAGNTTTLTGDVFTGGNTTNSGDLTVGISSPIAPTLGTTAGGALSATTDFVVYRWVKSGGYESDPSPEVSIAVAANNLLTVTIPAFPTGVVAANIYVSDASTAQLNERLQTTITTSGGTWTEPISGLLTTGQPWAYNYPGGTNAGGKLKVAGTSFFSGEAVSSNQYGLVNIGDAPFDGNTFGHFVGSSSGTLLAMNAGYDFSGDFINVESQGNSLLNLDQYNDLAVNYGNLWVSSLSSPLGNAPTLSQSTAANLPGTYYVKETWTDVNINESKAGSEAGPFTVSSGNTLVVTVDNLPNWIDHANIYISNSGSGNEKFQGAIYPGSGPYTFTLTSFNNSGSSPPAYSSFGGQVYAGGMLQVGNAGVLAGVSGGQELVVTAPSGFTGALADLQSAGTIEWKVDASGNMTVAGNDNIFTSAANTGANYGVVDIGSGGFVGGSGNFSGSSAGTQLAINAPSSFAGNLFDFQQNGLTYLKMNNNADITQNYGNYTINVQAAPSVTATLGQSAGGAIGATTYYVVYTWVNGNGETNASSENSFAVSANNVLTVTVPSFPSGITSANVYVSTTTGTETKQGSISTSGGTWTEPTSGLVAGSAYPLVNTTGGLITARRIILNEFSNFNTAIVLNNTNVSSSVSPLIQFQTNGSNARGIYSDTSANLMLQSSSGTVVDTFSNAGSITAVGNNNVFSAAANAGANYGIVNIGSGGFSGSAGNFSDLPPEQNLLSMLRMDIVEISLMPKLMEVVSLE